MEGRVRNLERAVFWLVVGLIGTDTGLLAILFHMRGVSR